MNDYVLVSGDFTTWGGMDHANYELAWYLAESTEARVHIVSHFVMEPLATHPKVVWHQVPRPLNRHQLAGPFLNYVGKKIARQLVPTGARVIVNGGNCAWPGINWVHAVHAAWERRDAHAPLAFRWRASWQKRAARQAERQALTQARFVFANSDRTRCQLIEQLGLSPNRVRTIYFGVDANVFRPPNQQEKDAERLRLGWSLTRPVVLFIGALGHDRNKGFDLLFSAWKQLCARRDWQADLVVVGTGAEVLYWQSQATAVGLSERIRVVGFTKDVSPILRAADLLVSPTHYEAYGISVHEALCTGIPAFVTRSAGIAERYPPELRELLLQAPPKVEELVERLRHWQANQADYTDRVRAFSDKLRQRSWTDMAREIVAFTEEFVTATASQSIGIITAGAAVQS